MDSHSYITVDDVRRALRQIHRSDTESNLKSTLLHLFSDELKPIDQKGHYRPSPLLLLWLFVLCALVTIFIYFSLRGHG